MSDLAATKIVTQGFGEPGGLGGLFRRTLLDGDFGVGRFARRLRRFGHAASRLENLSSHKRTFQFAPRETVGYTAASSEQAAVAQW
jgi:hypothetical protein